MNIENGYELVARMEKLGYAFEGDKYPKLINLFFAAGLREDGMIPAAILTGLPGAGKTFMAEAFAKAINAETVFYQCTEGTNSSTLVGDINPAEVVRGNAAGAVAPGAIVKLCKASQPCVLILDEWDKGDASLDAFLLDFLQSRRTRDMNGEMQYAPASHVWVFLTSNAERPISDALRRRVRHWEIPRMSAETAADILGISLQHPLMKVWEGVPSLALSQLQSYIDDVGITDVIDAEVLGQYIELPEGFQTGAKDKSSVTVVEVSAAEDRLDVSAILESAPESTEYKRYGRVIVRYSVQGTEDWIELPEKIRRVVLPEMLSCVDIDISSDKNSESFVIPHEALSHMCAVVNDRSDRTVVLTKTNRVYVGRHISDTVRFDNGIRDILGIKED